LVLRSRVVRLDLSDQFFVHTDVVRQVPRPLEYLFNTPSHHRVHHARNPRYIDRNFGGVLIIWDRLFGTFEPERDDEPCEYGITRQIHSHNPFTLTLHEWRDMLRDARHSGSLSGALRTLFGKPPAHQPSRRPLRQSLVDWPVQRRNARLNAATSSYPRFSASVVTPLSVRSRY